MVERALVSLGRFLLALIFLVTAFRSATDIGSMVARLADKGMPYPQVASVGAIALETVGGLMLATGFQPRLGALLLMVFLIPTTILFHPVTVPEQQIQFLINLGLLGGLCIVAGTGEGKRSL
jgi:uncharacterized membrane protein YphA (DoxX/SURF4 family)